MDDLAKPGPLTSLRLTIAALVALVAPVAYGQESGGAGGEPDLAEIDRQLNNPRTNLWSQYSIIRPESYRESWNFLFQITPVIKSSFRQEMNIAATTYG